MMSQWEMSTQTRREIGGMFLIRENVTLQPTLFVHAN